MEEIEIMSRKLQGPEMDILFQAICSLKNCEEAYSFFEDICTINELQSISQRFQVAKMLREQKVYTEITRKTGASTATISRVKKALDYGNDGYDLVFNRLKMEKKLDTEEKGKDERI